MALIHHSRAFLTNPTTGVRYNGGTFFGSYPFLMVNWTGSYTSVTASTISADCQGHRQRDRRDDGAAATV